MSRQTSHKARVWKGAGYVKCTGGTKATQMLWREQRLEGRACESRSAGQAGMAACLPTTTSLRMPLVSSQCQS